ncbi:MAG TPA: HIT family protein [Desulfomonilaceae bacterium]|nr:HIT family protein [Desulfomonilaceae bacterium]
MKDCIFCKIVAGEIPSIKVFEDDTIFSFMDISPLNTGHLLVIPKQHYGTILETEPELYGNLYRVVCRISRAVQAALNPDGINIMQLNGKAANQVVPHLHIHVVPRWQGDGLTISAWEPIPGDKADIARVAEIIKSRM